MLRPREVIAPAGFAEPAAMIETLRLAAVVTSCRAAGRSTPKRRGARCSSSCRRRASPGSASRGTPAAVSAAGALVHYLRETQKADLAHIREVSYRIGADCLLIDPTTLKNLERHRVGRRRPERIAAARDRSHA